MNYNSEKGKKWIFLMSMYRGYNKIEYVAVKGCVCISSVDIST